MGQAQGQGRWKIGEPAKIGVDQYGDIHLNDSLVTHFVEDIPHFRIVRFRGSKDSVTINTIKEVNWASSEERDSTCLELFGVWLVGDSASSDSTIIIDTCFGELRDMHKNKIGNSCLKAIGDGWFEYDYGSMCHIVKLGSYVANKAEHKGRYPIYIIPLTGEDTKSDEEAEKEEATGEEKPSIHFVDYSHLENEGYTLTRTSTIDGIKCDHYEKGDSKLRVFRKSNGDYVVDFEDEFGFDRVPQGKNDELHLLNEDWLAYSVTSSEGFKIYHNAGVSMMEYPTGIRRSLKSVCRLHWQKFKQDDLNMDKIRSSGFYGTDSISDYPVHILLPGDSEKYKMYDYKGERTQPLKVFRNDGFYQIKDFVYELDEYGNLHRRAQKCGDYFYYVNSSDSIVDVQMTPIDDNFFRCDIKYANGDNMSINKVWKGTEKESLIEADIVYSRSGKTLYGPDRRLDEANMTGKIHRNGRLLEIKGDYTKDLIMTNPDGSKCRIYKFSNHFGGGLPYLTNEILTEEVLELADYVQYFPDGREIVYEGGVTEKERKAKEEAKRKAQEKEVMAAIKALNDKYGEKFVEAALIDGKPIIGMPEELLRAAFRTELIRESGYSKCYRVIGSGVINGWGTVTLSDNLTKCYVWVTAGRVSSIRF